MLTAVLAGAPLLTALAVQTEPAAQAGQDSLQTAPADDKKIADQFTAAIDKFNAVDPQSPDTLNTRLAYANFLTKLDGGDCRAHLDEAQNELGAAKDNRALALLLPDALAHIADVEYQLHSARATCGADAKAHDQELRAALESAQRAVNLYRDAFEPVSMVTMQFNVGVAYHELGDTAAAVAALKTTLDLDHEYGFADDAEDNYRLLLQWSNKPAGSEQIAALMKDFPERSVTLSFGWRESDASLTWQTDVSQLAGTDFVHFQASRNAQRQVRRGLASWVVSYRLEDPHVEFGELPAGELLASSFASSIAQLLVHFHGFRVSRRGDFDWGYGDFRFESRARADAKSLTRDLSALTSEANDGHSTQLGRRIHTAVRETLSTDALEARVAEDYNLETGTWIGATLDQGVWYDMTAALFVPIAPQVFLGHDIQFTYSRAVPCVADSREASCIEILLHAVPDPAILKSGLDELAHTAHLEHGKAPRLWSVTMMRLVLDPATLWTYSRETEWHGYWSNGLTGPDQSLIESEKSIMSMSAPNPVSAPTP